MATTHTQPNTASQRNVTIFIRKYLKRKQHEAAHKLYVTESQNERDNQRKLYFQLQALTRSLAHGSLQKPQPLSAV